MTRESDEILLYANDMQRSYAEYGTETRIEPTEETFGSTSDQIQLMALIQTL